MTFHQSIKQIREQLNLSQKAFADALGVSFSTINRWENGRHVPNKITVNAIEAFCIANGVSFAYTEALEE